MHDDADGPIEPFRSAEDAAEPRWWHATDGRWSPPTVPPEPAGTVHRVGERPRTWQGAAPHLATGARVPEPSRADVALRRANVVALVVGGVLLVLGATLLALELAHVDVSREVGLVAVCFFAMVPLYFWMAAIISAREREAGNPPPRHDHVIAVSTYLRYVPGLALAPMAVLVVAALVSMLPHDDRPLRIVLGLSVALTVLPMAVILGEALERRGS